MLSFSVIDSIAYVRLSLRGMIGFVACLMFLSRRITGDAPRTTKRGHATAKPHQSEHMIKADFEHGNRLFMIDCEKKRNSTLLKFRIWNADRATIELIMSKTRKYHVMSSTSTL